MSARMKADLVCEVLRSAYGQHRPADGLILNRHTGSQYASRAYRRLASVIRRANARDNAPIEKLFKTLNVERIYQVGYEIRE